MKNSWVASDPLWEEEQREYKKQKRAEYRNLVKRRGLVFGLIAVTVAVATFLAR